MSGSASRTSILLAVLLAHALLAAMIVLTTHHPLHTALPERVTFIVTPFASLLPKTAIPETVSDGAPPVAAPATARPASATPAKHRPRPSPTSAPAAASGARPDPCLRPLLPGQERPAGIACDATLHTTPPLILPGSLHLDERGDVVPDDQDLFASLPPTSADQIAADADRHFAELRQNFPKWQPHTMELWKSEPMDFCGCSIVVVGTSIALEW